MRLNAADARFAGQVVVWNAALPGILIAYDYARGQLGANPTEALTRTTGVLAVVFLCLTLVVTPLVGPTKQYWITPRRRALGLSAFYYALAHVFTYVAFNRGWDLRSVPADVLKHPYILVGFASWLAMVPLAVTSTNAMIRRLGPKRWKTLHRLTYGIAVGGVVHWALIVKSDLRWPIAFGAVTALLLALRVRFRPKPRPSRVPPRAGLPRA